MLFHAACAPCSVISLLKAGPGPGRRGISLTESNRVHAACFMSCLHLACKEAVGPDMSASASEASLKSLVGIEGGKQHTITHWPARIHGWSTTLAPLCIPHLLQGSYTIVMKATGDDDAALFCVEIDFHVHWLGGRGRVSGLLGGWLGTLGGSTSRQ